MNKKVIIEITDADKPPKVTINGESVHVKELEYYYDSESDIRYGSHELLATVFNSEKKQFDKVGFEK